MRQELESFIEEKQAELDQWKEEETKLTRELEEIRLQASSLDQKNQFDQENLNRLNSETQTLENEQKSIYESLAHSSEEMEQKKADDPGAENRGCQLWYPGAGSKAAAGEMAEGERGEKRKVIKNFLKKEISFPVRSAFWTKSASVCKARWISWRRAGKNVFPICGRSMRSLPTMPFPTERRS